MPRASSTRRFAYVASVATERAPGTTHVVATEQDSLAVTFVNIDWKATRHNTPAAVNRNVPLLRTTVRSIVNIQRPAVICFCEVGGIGPRLSLTSAQMDVLVEAIVGAWQEQLQSARLQHNYTQGQPYLTVWDAAQGTCFDFRITHGLYEPQPFRSAQLFGIRAGELEADIVNIHLASSNKHNLSDACRASSLRNLFRRKSAYHNGTVGLGRCIIGGDMNTEREPVAVHLSDLKSKGVLHKNAECHVIVPTQAKHGDLAITIGLKTLGLSGEATVCECVLQLHSSSSSPLLSARKAPPPAHPNGRDSVLYRHPQRTANNSSTRALAT